MIISAFSDGERKDKIAEFYDTDYPCSFLRGLLVESEEQEKPVQITFKAGQRVCRCYEKETTMPDFNKLDKDGNLHAEI